MKSNFKLIYICTLFYILTINLLVVCANLESWLSHGVPVAIGVMAGTLIRLLAVETGDAPEVGGGNEEGRYPGGEECTKSSVHNDVVLANVVASEGSQCIVVAAACVVQVNIKASGIDNQEDGACNESTNKGPEEEASKLRPAGKASHQTEDGYSSKDESANAESPKVAELSLLHECEDD
jgi:hypothetical protein